MVTRHTDNRLALGRLGALVEQLHALVRSGRQVILVTSGAVCVGRQVLRQQHILNSSPLQMMGNHNFCGELRVTQHVRLQNARCRGPTYWRVHAGSLLWDSQ